MFYLNADLICNAASHQLPAITTVGKGLALSPLEPGCLRCLGRKLASSPCNPGVALPSGAPSSENRWLLLRISQAIQAMFGRSARDILVRASDYRSRGAVASCSEIQAAKLSFVCISRIWSTEK